MNKRDVRRYYVDKCYVACIYIYRNVFRIMYLFIIYLLLLFTRLFCYIIIYLFNYQGNKTKKISYALRKCSVNTLSVVTSLIRPASYMKSFNKDQNCDPRTPNLTIKVHYSRALNLFNQLLWHTSVIQKFIRNLQAHYLFLPYMHKCLWLTPLILYFFSTCIR